MGTVGSVAIGRPVLPFGTAVLAVLVGIGVTIAAAIEPARRASRIQPVEALRARLDQGAARTARLRWLAVVFVVVAVVGLVILPRAAGGTATVQGSSSTRSCWAPPCSSRSCCRRWPASRASRSPLSCASRNGSPGAPSCATAAGRH